MVKTETWIEETLRAQSTEIYDAGHNGWGNTMTFAAEKIESLKAEIVGWERSLPEHPKWDWLRQEMLDAVGKSTHLSRMEKDQL